MKTVEDDISVLIIGDSIGHGDIASDEEHKWDYLLKRYIENKPKFWSKVTLHNKI